ncbi:MAG: SIMPL domain-containing protein [Bacteroidaceae bacterium]|nr:SIMPL domain-containing protein [Bacteroidaceae bacterium]
MEEPKKERKISVDNEGLGCCLMVGLIVGALLLGNAIRASRADDRVVSVKGLCEREVKADKVICPFAYKEGGDNLQQLYRTIEEKNGVIIEFLKDAGISEEEITIAAPKVVDTRTEWSGSQNRYDYIVTSVVTVCTDKVDEIIALQSRQGELLQCGIATAASWEYQTVYSFTKLNEIKPAMIETATKNARETAEKFAADSDSKLGKIKRATQGQFSITDRDSNTPYMKNVRVVTSVDYYLKD